MSQLVDLDWELWISESGTTESEKKSQIPNCMKYGPILNPQSPILKTPIPKSKLPIGIFTKGLVTPRDHGFFLSKNHVIEEMLKFLFCQYLLF